MRGKKNATTFSIIYCLVDALAIAIAAIEATVAQTAVRLSVAETAVEAGAVAEAAQAVSVADGRASGKDRRGRVGLGVDGRGGVDGRSGQVGLAVDGGAGDDGAVAVAGDDGRADAVRGNGSGHGEEGGEDDLDNKV